jgi:hypothetical protein
MYSHSAPLSYKAKPRAECRMYRAPASLGRACSACRLIIPKLKTDTATSRTSHIRLPQIKLGDSPRTRPPLPFSPTSSQPRVPKAARTARGLECSVHNARQGRMETESVLHGQLQPNTYRTLQPQATQAINSHGQPHLGHHQLATQPGLDLSGLDDPDSTFHQDLRLQDPHGHPFQLPHSFDPNHGHRPMHVQGGGSPHTPQQQQQQQHNSGQFGILTTGRLRGKSIARLQQEEDLFGTPEGSDQKSNGHLSTNIVVAPPNLAEWRQRLFDVDDMITLSEEECVPSDMHCPVLADSVQIGIKRTFLTLIMSTRTVQPKLTSANPSSLTIGTVVLRADPQEHPSQMIRTRRRESELRESVIFVMSRSK